MNMSFGRPYGQCGYCGKWVRLAGFLAGWHFCLTSQERLEADRIRAMQQQQISPQGVGGLMSLVDQIFGGVKSGN